MNRLIAGEDVSVESLDSNDTRQLAVVASIAFVAFVIAIVLFLRWFHRAHANLPALGATTRFKPWWAIVGWFVPILVALATEADRERHLARKRLARSVGPSQGGRSAGAPQSLVGGGSSKGSSTAGRPWRTSPHRPRSTPVWRHCSEAPRRPQISAGRRSTTFVASGIDIVAAVLAILVIRQLTARQQERERMLAEVPETASSSTTAVD